MRDGISIARRGIPAIALVSSDFVSQGNFVARAAGMPEVPRIEFPHPLAGSGTGKMTQVAEALANSVSEVFAGELKGEIQWREPDTGAEP